jgi:hypothetical protein
MHVVARAPLEDPFVVNDLLTSFIPSYFLYPKVFSLPPLPTPCCVPCILTWEKSFYLCFGSDTMAQPFFGHALPCLLTLLIYFIIQSWGHPIPTPLWCIHAPDTPCCHGYVVPFEWRNNIHTKACNNHRPNAHNPISSWARWVESRTFVECRPKQKTPHR